jgi:phage gpG-like protein
MSDYSLSVQVIGAKELKDALSSVDGFAKNAIKDAINKTAYSLQRQAVQNAPHKTGTLWGSIHTDSSPGHLAQVKGNNIEAVVGTNLEYARAQELGTVGMTINVPNGRRTKNGGRTKPYSFIGNIKPKYYFQKARDSIKPIFTNNLQDAMKKIVDYLATKGTSAS